MKCPKCRYVAKDTWDICPRCHLDLRPQKQLLNIKISDPHSSYEVLFQNLGLDPKKKFAAGPLGSSRSQSGIGKWVRNFLGFDATPPRPAEFIPIPEATTPQVDQPSDSPPVANLRQVSAPPQEIIFQIFDEVVATPLPAPGVDLYNPISPLESPGAPSEPKPAATADPEQNNSDPPYLSELSQPDSIQSRNEIGQRQGEHFLRLTESLGVSLLADNDSIDHLFDTAVRSVVLSAEKIALEFGAEQLVLNENAERINLLFSLAEESIRDPTTLGKYIETITTSDQRAVVNQQLSAELKATEAALSQPVFYSERG